MNIENTNYYRELNNRAQKTVPYGISNCIGSVEYFTQEKDVDEFSSTKEGKNLLEKMMVVENPVVGGVVRWKTQGNETYHAAVIVEDKNGLKVTHRDKKNGAVFNFHDIRGIPEDRYSYLEREYLVPTKLQKILGLEVQKLK